MQGAVRLGSGTARAYATLITDITGRAPAALPWLSPALLFASPDGQRYLTLPAPGPDELLIHDYQSVTYEGALPLDTPLTAETRTKGNDHHISLAANGAPVARLTTALRLIPRSDLAAAVPTAFPARLTDSLDWSTPMTVTQDQTDRYLALSGDPNPIHSDPALAAELGLAAPIVPGLLLAALIQPDAEARITTRLISLKARFMAPLMMEDPVRLALQPRGATRQRAYLATQTRALAMIDLDTAE